MRARVQTPHFSLGRPGPLGQPGREAVGLGGQLAREAVGPGGGRDARTGGAGEGATVSGYDVWGCGRPGPPPPLSEKIHLGPIGIP